MSQIFTSDGQSIGVSASTSVLPINIQDWFPLGWTGWISLQSKGFSNLLQHCSKASILQYSAFFIVQLSHLYMTTGKTIALTKWTFVGKVMPLLFNMLSRLVITYLPTSKHLFISWLQSPSAVIFSSVHSVVSDSLQPYQVQHARPPCPSPTPGVHPNPCPLSRWCHPTISYCVVPLSSCPPSFPASWSFPVSQLLASGGQKPKKIKFVTVSTVFPSICHEVMGLDAMILVFWMLSVKPTFHSPLSLSSRDSLVLLHFLP